MKEASGELSLTAITAVAIAAVATLFYTLVWPTIKLSILNNTCSAYGEGWHAVKKDANLAGGLNGANANDQNYACCPSGTNQYSAQSCLDADDA